MVKPRVVNKLGQFINGVQGKAAVSMAQALVRGASEASVLTPIKSSTLLNSQFRNIEADGSKVVGTMGYTAEYAILVHDPENPQKFRRPSAEKEFLSKGFEAAEPSIRAILIGAIKT